MGDPGREFLGSGMEDVRRRRGGLRGKEMLLVVDDTLEPLWWKAPGREVIGSGGEDSWLRRGGLEATPLLKNVASWCDMGIPGSRHGLA